MTTMGDRVLNISLPKIGEKSLFTKDLEDALHCGRVDFVVHSLKDLPTVLPAGMAIGAILAREDPRDALVLNSKWAGRTLATLDAGSIIGTSSLRRSSQLKRKYPHLVVADIRGNLNTRLAKLDAEGSTFAGIILAQAGLMRMGWSDRINETLDETDILYAVGQGALAVECRAADVKMLSMLRKLSCWRTQFRILTERSFLKALGGGCSAPVAVVTVLSKCGGGGEDEDGDNCADDEHEMHITGAVWSLDGSTELQSKLKCTLQAKSDRNADEGKRTNTNGNNDSDDENELPRKRQKLDDINDEPSSPTTSLSNVSSSSSTPSKPDSPTLVDDTPGPVAGAADMTTLLRIHGNLLTKCPYAQAHQQNGDGDRCPTTTRMTVGQEVMGQCPYLNAEQKVLASEMDTASTSVAADVMGKCPLSPEDRAKIVAATISRTKSTANAVTGSCPFAKDAAAPFLSTTIQRDNETDSTGCTNNKVPIALAVTGCPFLQQSTLVDQPSDRSADTKSASDYCGDGGNVPLYCGLFRHECFSLNWFERCEMLGQQLAKQLIANGALGVIECAQREIHGA